MPYSFEPRLIRGSGPVPSPVAFFGEAGGRTEHEQRSPFAGKAGIVLNTYLSSVGLKRYRVYVDNVYPYWTGPGNPDPTDEQVAENLPRLKETLLKVRPRIIGCLGRIAAKWILFNGQAEVDLDAMHGIAFEREWPWGKVLIVPCYHPAAGFYEPLNAARCQWDLGRVALAAEGKVAPWVEEPLPTSELVPLPHYRSGHAQIREGDAVDTEGTSRHPSLMSWATEGETRTISFVSRFDPKVILSPTFPGRVTFHFALHDLDVARAMGVNTDRLEYDDTMVMAFDLGTEPQRLKALAYRHLHVKMTDYDDVVRPYYNREVRRYIVKLLDTPLPAKSKSVLVQKKNPKTGEMEDALYTPQPPERRFWAVLAAAGAKDGEPEKVWEDLPKAHVELAARNLPNDHFPSYSRAIELVPEKIAVQYAGADAWATKKLKPILIEKLKAAGLEKVYEVDRASLPYVDLMQREGLPVDLEKAKALSKELEKRIAAVEKRLVAMIGKRFNPGSPDDVSDILYRKYQLSIPKLTDGGDPSTDKKAIQILRQRAPFEIADDDERVEVLGFLDGLIEHREAKKNKGTFVDVIILTAEDRGNGLRVYSNLKTTRVASGRLSSGKIGRERSLNVLAMPTRTEEGKRIRGLFVAPDGWNFLSADLSQIELRVMAGASRDKRMLSAFVKGEDLHILTTSLIFGIDRKKITKQSPQRFVGKTLNFAIMYGISARALLEQLAANGIYDYSLRDCEKFIAEWFKVYPGVREYLEHCWMKAEETGEVRDWLGRVRYVPNIRVPKGPTKEAAKREVGNHPIQSGAHEQVKLAEIELAPWMVANRKIARPVLQIHDELLVLTKVGKEKQVAARLVAALTNGAEKRFGVPVKADASWGKSWAEAK